MYKLYCGMPDVQQLVVDPAKASWDVEYPDYQPPSFTKKEYLIADDAVRPKWGDHPDVRRSFDNLQAKQKMSNFVIDANGNPLHPLGRQGLTGRGNLGEHGPQYAADPIVSVWATDDRGKMILNAKKQVLIKFVCIERLDKGKGSGKALALPGGIRDRMLDKKDQTLKPDNLFLLEDSMVAAAREFKEEALGAKVGPYGLQEPSDKLQDMFRKEGVVLLENVVVKTDPRSTDNAWMETTVLSLHDPTGDIEHLYGLKPGASETKSYWQIWDPMNEPALYADHNEYMRLHYERVIECASHGKYACYDRNVVVSKLNDPDIYFKFKSQILSIHPLLTKSKAVFIPPYLCTKNVIEYDIDCRANFNKEEQNLIKKYNIQSLDDLLRCENITYYCKAEALKCYKYVSDKNKIMGVEPYNGNTLIQMGQYLFIIKISFDKTVTFIQSCAVRSRL
jgi:hypothetical protein